MAKNTKKENALAMFGNTNSVKVKKPVENSAPKVDAPAEPKNDKPVQSIKEVEEPTIKEEVVEKIVATEKVTEEVKDSAPATPKINFKMSPKPAKSGHGRTVYLSYEIEEKLKKGAEMNNCSISEFLNFILGQVL